MEEKVMLTQPIEYDYDFIVDFEEGIDPLNPEKSMIPAKVLGYGEMSTVLSISGGNPDLVYKRMPMFRNKAEWESYAALYDACEEHLTAAGIDLVPARITAVTPREGNIAGYIVQRRLDGRTLVHKAIHTLPAAEVQLLFEAILQRIGRVFAYSAAENGVALGLDAQMSNWAIANYQPDAGSLPNPIELIYIDTSSPLMQVNGVHQIDPELFLRSAPFFLRPILRLLFVDDVVNRYFDRRKIIIDVLGNLYKEKREELIPELIQDANRFLETASGEEAFKPLSQEEVAGYYREDARIWSIYLGARRFDRSLHQLLGKPYPYILPGNINR
jgi:Family of unknown function (DUF6206)